MKSGLNIANALRNLLNVEQLVDEISGGIYKFGYPLKSQKEDVVINILAINGEYLQKGYANMNIYVENAQSGLPNTKRLEELTSIVNPLVDKKKAVDKDIVVTIDGEQTSLIQDRSYVFFEIASPGVVLKDQERENTYYTNIKLKYNTL